MPSQCRMGCAHIRDILSMARTVYFTYYFFEVLGSELCLGEKLAKSPGGIFDLTFDPESIGAGLRSQLLMWVSNRNANFSQNPTFRPFRGHWWGARMAGNWRKPVMEGIYQTKYVPIVQILGPDNILRKNNFHPKRPHIGGECPKF